MKKYIFSLLLFVFAFGATAAYSPDSVPDQKPSIDLLDDQQSSSEFTAVHKFDASGSTSAFEEKSDDARLTSLFQEADQAFDTKVNKALGFDWYRHWQSIFESKKFKEITGSP